MPRPAQLCIDQVENVSGSEDAARLALGPAHWDYSVARELWGSWTATPEPGHVQSQAQAWHRHRSCQPASQTLADATSTETLGSGQTGMALDPPHSLGLAPPHFKLVTAKNLPGCWSPPGAQPLGLVVPRPGAQEPGRTRVAPAWRASSGLGSQGLRSARALPHVQAWRPPQ